MNLTLTPELEAMVQEKVERGDYPDADEVVGAALRLLDEHDRMRRLRAALAIGQEQIQRGETVTFTPELMERLKFEADQDARAGKPIPDEVKP